jgi:hypothetical protein
VLRFKLEKRTRHVEQHPRGLEVAKRIEPRTAIAPIEESCDRHIEHHCAGEKLACRHPELGVLELMHLLIAEAELLGHLALGDAGA